MEFEENKLLFDFVRSDDILYDVKEIIEISQKRAHQSVNFILVQRNWLLGYRIAEEELKGNNRAGMEKKL